MKRQSSRKMEHNVSLCDTIEVIIRNQILLWQQTWFLLFVSFVLKIQGNDTATSFTSKWSTNAN